MKQMALLKKEYETKKARRRELNNIIRNNILADWAKTEHEEISMDMFFITEEMKIIEGKESLIGSILDL